MDVVKNILGTDIQDENRMRKCRNCEKDYHTVIEDDYTGYCSKCEDLPWGKLKR
jgi:hypothetical protein